VAVESISTQRTSHFSVPLFGSKSNLKIEIKFSLNLIILVERFALWLVRIRAAGKVAKFFVVLCRRRNQISSVFIKDIQQIIGVDFIEKLVEVWRICAMLLFRATAA
jgi:hypothetical protein